MPKSKPVASMVLLAAVPQIGEVVKRALGRFDKIWKPGGYDVIVIATKKGTGPRAAKKIRDALEVEK